MNPRDKPLVRRYQPGDEPAVRRLCFETAIHGATAADVFDDVPLVSEALLGPYIRAMPHDLLVVCAGQTVAGYLAGCFDVARLREAVGVRWALGLAGQFMRGGHWHRLRAWRFAWTAGVHARQVRRLMRPLHVAYPAHLHINVDAYWRRDGLGSLLLERFGENAYAADAAGVCVSTATEPGRRFFTKHGFRLLAETRPLRAIAGPAVHISLMGKSYR